MKTYLFISCLLFAYFSNAQDWKKLSKAGYEITYPSSWELNESAGAASFILLSSQENGNDIFRENVNLVEQDLTGMNLNLEKYTEISLSQVKQLIQNSKLVSSNTVDNHQEVIYEGDQANYRLKFLQYYWVIGNKAYVLTFTAQTTNFDKYLETGKRIMNSFTLK